VSHIAKTKEELVQELMHLPEQIRNIGTAAHIDHGKTTLSDNLLAGAGMISEQLAGVTQFMDFTKQEQERGITIWAANASMVHSVEGKDYLVNLIDTPGHVDFSGDVTRAMRAIDGAIILVDAVESVMPQTETVIRQALRERVKPCLFVNKVDRLVRELKFTPEQMQERFVKIVNDVNRLILKYAEKEFAEKWLVNIAAGSVSFGSAKRKWAISAPWMKKKGVTFKDIITYTSTEKDDELARLSPLHQVVLDMVVRHLPTPKEAQKYRIPKIWLGDLESPVAKDMLNLNEKGPLAAVITKVVPDPHAGFVATARLFSGKISRGQEVRLIGQHMTRRIQQIGIYKGPERIQIESAPAGNIIAIVGMPEAYSGETICSSELEIHPFEAIKHIFEPVVTKSLEPKNPQDLPKLIQFLRQVSKEDPTLVVSINEETGEYLISGLGELHLDAKIERPLREKGIEIGSSIPIVVYRETVRAASPVSEGVSSNRHNRFYLSVEPIEESIMSALNEGKIRQDNVKKYQKEISLQLIEYGMGRDEAKNLVDIYNKNILIDATKGVQYLHETIELITEAFQRTMDQGPLAGEPCTGLKIKIDDVKLHEDAIHRGPAQVLPAVGEAVKEAMKRAKPTMLEPIQLIRIDTPEELMGPAMNQITNRRGQVMDMQNELGVAIITAKLPVAEMFGFEAALKSATGGKGFYSLIDVVFDKIPEDLRLNAIAKIRERKGLPKEAV
jgi:elongation factor 2